MIKGKKGLSLKFTLYAILIVGLMAYASTATIDRWSSKYDSGITSNLNDYDKSSDIISETQGYEGDLSPQSAGTGDDTETRTYKGVFGIITTIFRPIQLLTSSGGLVDKAGESFGVGGYYLGIIVTMIVLAVIFTLIKVIFRYPGGNV